MHQSVNPLKRFATNLIVTSREAKIIESQLIQFPGLSIDFNKDPSGRFWETLDGRGLISLSPGAEDYSLERINNAQKQLFLNSENEGIAEDALSLIHGGNILIYPDPDAVSQSVYLSGSEVDVTNDEYKKVVHSGLIHMDRVAYATHILKYAWTDLALSYAIHKYVVSLGLASFTPHSANPKHGQVFENFDHKRRYHVQAAHAIMLAFAAIEELQLEVRSSSKKKRFLDNKKGIWNPIVLEDINLRLAKIGIGEEDTIDWVYRGDSTEVHKSMAPQFGYDSDYQDWHKDVKDKTLTYAEALHNASYLRNFFAAHKFQELSQYLSPYDVYNVQDLARTLILHKVELWEDHAFVDLYHKQILSI